jgi:creatinine amidohydrolase
MAGHWRVMMKMNFALLLLLLAANASAQSVGAYLGELTWPEAEQRLKSSPLVILPFAAGAKEHGPHLPMNADRKVMEYLVKQAVDQLPVLATPAVLHGWFPAFRDYPGTEVAEPEVFQRYVFLIAESLVRHGARRIVFLNMGIAKATGLPLAIAAREIRVRHGVPTLLVNWDDLETDEVAEFQQQSVGGHADEIETSVNLALQPGLVHMDRALRDDGREPKGYPGYRPGLFSRNKSDPAFSETGLRGDPTLASAEKGRKTLAIMTRNWITALEGFAEEPLVGKND